MLVLGGKSAAIILQDADIAKKVVMLKYLSFSNNGEACVGQTKILALIGKYDEICAALTQMASGIKVGNPTNADTFLRPIIKDFFQKQTEKSLITSWLCFGLILKN